MLQNQLKPRHLHKFSLLNRWDFIKTGLLIVSLAVCFIVDRTYFFYPPALAPAWNNIYFDATGLIAGLTLLTCGVFNLHVDLLIKLGLGISVAFLTVLLVAEMFHVVGVGYFRFHPAIIFEIYSVVNLMQLAFEYQPRQ